MAGLTVLLVVVWIGSGWWFGEVVTPNAKLLSVLGGRITLEPAPWASPTAGFSHFAIARNRVGFQLGFEWDVTNYGWSFFVPLWFPALLSLLATAAAWRADAKYLRRVREGACPACGYDRAGLAAGSLCPECGKQPEAR